MKSFALTEIQLTRLACALTGDELSRHQENYKDFLTRAAWSAETKLGAGGLALTEKEIEACALRVCSFFDKSADLLQPTANDTFGDWAARLLPAVHKSVQTLKFYPATQAGSAETRHAADEIWQDARVIAGLMHGRRRVITMVSSHTLTGFVTTVLAPNLQRLEVLDGRGMAPDLLAETLTFGDLLVATPTLWRYLVQTIPGFANNVMGVSYGEPLPLGLASQLREKGLGAMRELYGSTETGLIGWRDSPSDPFVLFDHWYNQDPALIRIRPDGQEREMTAMDHLEWADERAFTVEGRRDGAVQIGAVNVFPRKISQIIAEHPDIEKCTVRVAQRSGALDRLIAHITLVKNISSDQAMAWKVDEWCRKKLRPPERPRIYVFE